MGEGNEKEIRKRGKDTQKECNGEKDTRKGVGNKLIKNVFWYQSISHQCKQQGVHGKWIECELGGKYKKDYLGRGENAKGINRGTNMWKGKKRINKTFILISISHQFIKEFHGEIHQV